MVALYFQDGCGVVRAIFMFLFVGHTGMRGTVAHAVDILGTHSFCSRSRTAVALSALYIIEEGGGEGGLSTKTHNFARTTFNSTKWPWSWR